MNQKRLVFFIFIVMLGMSGKTVSGHGIDSLKPSGGSLFWQQFREDSLYTFRNHKGYVPMLLHNFGEQACAPFHMTGRDALWLTGISIASASVFFADQEVERIARPLNDRNPWLKSLSPEFTQLGDYYGYALLAGYGAYSLVFHKRKALHTAVLASQAAITAGVWVRVIKLSTGRMRPGATYNDRQFTNDHWFGPLAQFDADTKRGRSVAAFDAFPSGHTAAAFSIATVFALEYKDKKAVPVIAYSLASLVALSRLIEHEHWASDLIPGAIIGYGCGKQVVNYYRKLFPATSSANEKKSQSSFYFTNSQGVRIHYSLVF